MAFIRVDTRPLLSPLREELLAVLGSLSEADWGQPTACPGWSVHYVATHLLGVEIGNVSLRRDRWVLRPRLGEDFDAWINGFNQQWVEASRRISPALLMDLLDHAGRRFEAYVGTLDLDATGPLVSWATGMDPAPVWLDVGREYMERYVHQSQIREAVGYDPLGTGLTAPVLIVAAHALARALRQVTRPPGTVVAFTAEGQAGGTWYLVQSEAGWDLVQEAPNRPPSCHARTTVNGALKLYVRDPSAPALSWEGDDELADALSNVKAVLG